MSDCVVSHGNDKNGIPRHVQADNGKLCRNHSRRLNGWLRDIAVDYALLDTRAVPGASGHERSAQGFESQPPMNITVAALRDAERAFPPRPRGDELWYELPDVPSVVATVHARAEEVRAILDPTHDVSTELRDVRLAVDVRLLLNAFDTLLAADWVDEAFGEFKDVWIALQRAHDRPRPKPLGHCLTFDCDGTVWPRQDAPPWCSTCKRIYGSSAEWVKIRIQEEQRRAKKKLA